MDGVARRELRRGSSGRKGGKRGQRRNGRAARQATGRCRSRAPGVRGPARLADLAAQYSPAVRENVGTLRIMGARRDPRAEPTTVPPDAERVEKLGNLPPMAPTSMRLPRAGGAADDEAAKEPASTRDANVGVPDPGGPPVPVGATTGRVITSADPRLEIVEGPLATDDWRKVASDLGPLEKAGGLPP